MCGLTTSGEAGQIAEEQKGLLAGLRGLVLDRGRSRDSARRLRIVAEGDPEVVAVLDYVHEPEVEAIRAAGIGHRVDEPDAGRGWRGYRGDFFGFTCTCDARGKAKHRKLDNPSHETLPRGCYATRRAMAAGVVAYAMCRQVSVHYQFSPSL